MFKPPFCPPEIGHRYLLPRPGHAGGQNSSIIPFSKGFKRRKCSKELCGFCGPFRFSRTQTNLCFMKICSSRSIEKRSDVPAGISLMFQTRRFPQCAGSHQQRASHVRCQSGQCHPTEGWTHDGLIPQMRASVSKPIRVMAREKHLSQGPDKPAQRPKQPAA